MNRRLRGLLLVAVSAVAMTSIPVIPVSTRAADDQAGPNPNSRSGRRYWLEQAERDRERERQRRQETEEYRRQNDARQRRWNEWWSERQQPRTPAEPQ